MIGFFQVIGRHDDGDAVLTELPDVVPYLEPALDVQPQGRFIQKHDLGIGEQPAGNIQFAFHAPGIGLGHAVRVLFEIDELQQFVDPRVRFRPGEMVESPQQFEVFATGEKPVDGAFLRHVTDQAPDGIRLPDDVVAQHRRRAGGWGQHGDQHPQGRTFPGAVGAQESEDFTGVHRERQVLDGRYRTEGFPQTCDVDHHGGIHHPPPDN